MKKNTKNILITILFIAVVVIIAIVIIHLTKKTSGIVDESVAKCIGQNSILYVQLGCSHCEDQKNLFGNSYQYLNVTDCFYETGVCINNSIEATPTWVIKDQRYVGVQTVEKIKELTGC